MKQKILYLLCCLLCISLVACQKTPESTVVINKSEGVLEDKISSEASETKLPDLPEKISEEVYKKEGKYSIDINADVKNLTLDEYPIYSIAPTDFTQTEVDTVIKYFFKDSPLYAENYTKSKSMIEEEIIKIKADMQRMDTNDKDDIKGAEAAIEKLEEEYASAPDTVKRTQITSELTIPSDVDYETLEAYADLGYSELSNISVANRPIFQSLYINLDPSRYYLASSLLEGKKAEGQEMTREEAKKIAEECLNEIGLEGFISVRVETGMTEDQSRQGYIVTFKRSVSGVPVAYNTIIDYSERVDMSAKWASDRIKVRLDNEGISGLDWSYKGEVQDVLNTNVELLTFDAILNMARQQLKNKFAWMEMQETGSLQTILIENIVLEYICTQQKNNPNRYLFVPAWNFYISGEVKSSEYYICALSVNAVDGSVLG